MGAKLARYFGERANMRRRYHDGQGIARKERRG
jgi:hypothetical protein